MLQSWLAMTWPVAQHDATVWAATKAIAVRRFATRLGDEYRVRGERSRTLRLSFLDDADHDLAANGYCLCTCGRDLLLGALDDGEVIATDHVDDNAAGLFAWNLPDGPLRQRVTRPLDVRALVELGRVTLKQRSLELRNRDGKLVVKMQWFSVQSRKRRTFCTIEPLRGYDDDVEHVQQVLESLGMRRAEGSVMTTLARGFLPPPKTNSPAPRPDLPAWLAVTRMARQMIDAARTHEPGVIDAIDTEFLHQYRVALRKARSLLALTRGVLDDVATRRFRETLGDIARRTNRLRDLDVYLLDESSYRKLCPPQLRDGLGVMFDDYRAERDAAQRKVAAYLQSKTYRDTIEALHRDLHATARSHRGPDAQAPIIDIARKRIGRRYRKARRLGMSIDDKTPDDRVHDLRIECKKLRYLLEFFQPILPRREVAALVKQLKKLQNTLGEFNDLAVQQQSLHNYLAGKEGLNGNTADVAMSIGGLVSALYQKQRAVRRHVRTAFDRFASASVNRLVKSVCSQKAANHA